jgi:hypothetical protein
MSTKDKDFKGQNNVKESCITVRKHGIRTTKNKAVYWKFNIFNHNSCDYTVRYSSAQAETTPPFF